MISWIHIICVLDLLVNKNVAQSFSLLELAEQYEYEDTSDPGISGDGSGDFSGETITPDLGSFSLDKNCVRNELNIGEPLEISQKSEAYQSYFDIISQLNQTMNLHADPCTDFYEYACGKSKREFDVFFEMEDMNDWNIIDAIEHFHYQNSSENSFANKAKRYFDLCTRSRGSVCRKPDGIKKIQKLMNDFSLATGYHFPTVPSISSSLTVNPTTLGKAIGILSTLNVDTFLTPSLIHFEVVGQPQYMLFIDQSTLYNPTVTYNITGVKEMESYQLTIKETLRKYSIATDARLSGDLIDKIATEVVNLEVTIAKQYSANEMLVGECYNTTKCYVDSFDDFTFINFTSFFEILAEKSTHIRKYLDSKTQPILARKFVLQKLDSDFSSKFQPHAIINYLYYRLLMSRRSYFTFPKKHCTKVAEHMSKDVNKGETSAGNGKGSETLLIDAKWECLQQIKTDMPEVADRFDLKKTDEEEKVFFDEYVREVMHNVRESVIEMVKRTFENDESSFFAVENELKQVDITIRYPSHNNDSILNLRYKDLNFTESDSYYEMREKLLEFRFNIGFELLTNGTPRSLKRLISADDVRYDFNEKLINIASTLLSKPFFDYEWPTSMVYGSLGSVIGHELIHSFADLQQRHLWAKNAYATTFVSTQRAIEDCLVRQYRQYCPLKDTGMQPECLDGRSSVSENSADTAGMIAAYLAYKTVTTFHGREPQLPDPIFRKLTHDQLFFLSYAHNFCRKPMSPSEWFAALVTTANYSPPKYRVLGPISNFAAFQNAFNCPLLSENEFFQRCYVWLPKPE